MAIVDTDDSVRVKISPRKYILSNLSKSSATANFCGVIDSTPKDSSQSLLSCLITYFVIIGLPLELLLIVIINLPSPMIYRSNSIIIINNT